MIIRSYSNPEEVSRRIIEDLLIPQLSQGTLSLAVSGGSTPKLLFELMASDSYRPHINWANLRLYWVDERCVPPTDEQSNYGMTAKALSLDELPLVPEHVYRIQGENNPQEEAQRYTQLVLEQLAQNEEGLPVFDLILLGIGDDGHTSSIFPHQMHWLEERCPYVVAQHPGGQNRICLTGATILAAKQLAFHAVGAGKQAILQQIQHNSPEAEAYPSTYFARRREDTLLYTDQTI